MRLAQLRYSLRRSPRQASCVVSAIILLSIFAPLVWSDDRGPNNRDASNLDAIATDVTINADGSTYDSHPSAVTTSDGTTWIAWHAYHDGRDSVLLRRVSADGELGTLHRASAEGSIHGPPTVAPLDDGSVWVVWSAKVKGRWQVLARHLRDGKWRTAVTVSDSESDAILPTAARVADGKMVVAWSARRNGLFRIRCRLLDGNTWREPMWVSSEAFDAFRPALSVDDKGEVWTFWDRYDGKRYNVQGRRMFPSPGPVEQVSPEGRHCLTPTALATRQGLCVAWLQKDDVVGGPGVISQWHTLHAAIRRDDGWKTIADENGNPAGAELTQGLVAKIEPRAVATGGYLGRRTAPMLLEDGHSVWLLWERKADHRGSTPKVVGDLVGRPMRSGVWKETVVLHTGRVDYHLSHPRRMDEGRFVMLASRLPRHSRRIYHRLVVRVADARPFAQDEWPGWRPVDLPIRNELTARRAIQVGQKSYQLYWADMHCHSGLTCDAEGEHDELTQYARDRARLDVVVFTNNDFLYDTPLTEYEYAMGNFFAGVYTRPGKFLSMPGYEWTSRIPGVETAKLSDVGNWTSPYRNRSYPNHRSVVYPPLGGPIVRFSEVANDIRALNAAVESAGGVTFTQHDAFLPSGHKVEVGMELTSGWRNYIARVPKLFHEPLNRGARLGFVANGDSHRRAPGLSGALTGIYAEELTAESILDALRHRRCFATNGSRIFIDARANGSIMGRDVPVHDGAVTLKLHAIGTRPIISAVLVRDGKQIRTFMGSGEREIRIEHHDTDLSRGLHWYYWRVAQERDAPDLPGNLMAAHGHLAWSTPHWIVSQ